MAGEVRPPRAAPLERDRLQSWAATCWRADQQIPPAQLPANTAGKELWSGQEMRKECRYWRFGNKGQKSPSTTKCRSHERQTQLKLTSFSSEMLHTQSSLSSTKAKSTVPAPPLLFPDLQVHGGHKLVYELQEYIVAVPQHWRLQAASQHLVLLRVTGDKGKRFTGSPVRRHEIPRLIWGD